MNPDFNSGFFLTIAGIITAFLSGTLVYCIKSKCSRCTLCYGLIDIQRDVALEEKIEEAEEEAELSKAAAAVARLVKDRENQENGRKGGALEALELEVAEAKEEAHLGE